MIGAAAAPATTYRRTFHGSPDQVGQARHDVAQHLGECPVADDAILIVSELAANAVLHSHSNGGFFTIRVELHADHARIECEDLGGPWQRAQPDGRPHGLDIIEALTGPSNWGAETASDGSRVVWARLTITLPEASDARVRIASRRDSLRAHRASDV